MSGEETSACGCSCGTPKPLFDEPEEHGPWWKDTELMKLIQLLGKHGSAGGW